LIGVIPEEFAKVIVLAKTHARASGRTNEEPWAFWIVAFAVDKRDRAAGGFPSANSEVWCIG
jgi:hypothetical protein